MIQHKFHRRHVDSTAATGRRPIVPEDLARFYVLSGPQISPDGRKIVFMDKQVGSRNDYVTNIWIVEVAEKGKGGRAAAPRKNGHAKSVAEELFASPRALTQGGKDSEPRWSPDGKTVAFVRLGSAGTSDLYMIPADGGEARRLTSFPEGSIGTFRWSPDGRMLAASFRARAEQWTEPAKKQREAAGLSEPPQVAESLLYRLDGEGYAVSQRRKLYLVDAATGDCREIFGGDVAGEFTFDFSSDSRQLVVSTNRSQEPYLEPWKDELLKIDVGTGRQVRISGLPKGPKTAVCWSPDGKTIAYAGRVGNNPYYDPQNLELFVCNAVGGSPRCLTTELDVCLQAHGIADVCVERAGPELQFSRDSRHIYCSLSVGGECHVAAIPVQGGKARFLTKGPHETRMGNLSADGRRMALTTASPVTLPEVAVLECHMRTARLAPLTNMNGPLLAELQLHAPQSHSIKAADGYDVQVWSIVPAAGDSRNGAPAKLPAVLEIHGGPHAQYGAGFFLEFQVLAAAGYAVFYSNPRGSKGYGRAHSLAIDGRWGTDDWTDIQAVIAFMKRHADVDAKRMGVMGGSYGGYLANWAISHCRDFAAAITDRCLSNLVSFSGSTDVVERPDYFFPGNFWDQADARWEQSPLKHAGNIRTPTLLIHSEGDLRCNIEQAEQLYSALKLLGVPVRFVRYPRSTSHGMSRSGPPDLRVHRLREILAWWERHLKRVKRRQSSRFANGAARVTL